MPLLQLLWLDLVFSRRLVLVVLERGAEFRRVANTAKEQHTKESFLKLAQSFEALAEAEEGVGTKGVPERGPTDA